MFYLEKLLFKYHALQMANKMFKVSEILSSGHSLEFKWTINNFSSRTEIASSEICNQKLCPLKWKIFIEFRDNSTTYYNYADRRSMSVGLQRIDSLSGNIEGSFIFKILNDRGDVYLKDWIDLKFTAVEKKCKSSFISIPSNNVVYGLNNKEFYCHHNVLIIEGKILVQKCCNERFLETALPPDTKQLQLDFKTLLQNSQFADVELKIKNDVIRAHKFVLCSRSPVFRKMFENNMKEKACNSVAINDIEKPVLNAFLEFLYTGIVEDKKIETVMALYSAADKYEVKTLQKTCSDILVSYIKHDTVSIIMKLADTHNDVNLKNIAIKYICHNFSNVESTSDWKNLLDSDPRLASFALKQVSLKLSNK